MAPRDADRAVEWAAVQADRTRSVLEIHAAFGSGSVFLAPSEVEGSNATLGRERGRAGAPRCTSKSVSTAQPTKDHRRRRSSKRARAQISSSWVVEDWVASAGSSLVQ